MTMTLAALSPNLAPQHLRGVNGAHTLNTPGLREIRANVAQLKNHGGIILIDGKPGVGKTFGTHEALTTCELNVYWADMSDTPLGKEAIARIFTAVIGRRPNRGMTSYELTETTCDALQGCQGVIVIDEAQNMTSSALRAVRFLHDRPSTKMLFVLIGSGVFNTVRGVPELDSRVSRRSMIRELGSKDLLSNLRELHPLLAATQEKVLVDLGEFAKGNLRNWARVLEVADSLAVDASRGIGAKEAKFIIRSITGGAN